MTFIQHLVSLVSLRGRIDSRGRIEYLLGHPEMWRWDWPDGRDQWDTNLGPLPAVSKIDGFPIYGKQSYRGPSLKTLRKREAKGNMAFTARRVRVEEQVDYVRR